MAKFFGKVGYLITVNQGDGKFIESIVEREYRGDVLKMSKRWQSSNKLNDDIVINDQISIIADAFTFENCHLIKYVEHLGAKWKVESIDPSNRPRIILYLGGVYNGPTE